MTAKSGDPDGDDLFYKIVSSDMAVLPVDLMGTVLVFAGVCSPDDDSSLVTKPNRSLSLCTQCPPGEYLDTLSKQTCYNPIWASP